MADSKITALTENTSPASTDLLVMVDDPSGSASTQKITIANFLKVVTFCYPFSTYFNIQPTSSSPSFPYSSTLPTYTTYIKKFSIAASIGATNNGSNYWTIALIDAGTTTTIASVSTAAESANTAVILSDTTMAITTLTQATHRYLYIQASKTGSPSNINIHTPAVEYTLT